MSVAAAAELVLRLKKKKKKKKKKKPLPRLFPGELLRREHLGGPMAS